MRNAELRILPQGASIHGDGINEKSELMVLIEIWEDS